MEQEFVDIPLTTDASHFLRVDPGNNRLRLCRTPKSGRSPLHEGFKKHLRFEINQNVAVARWEADEIAFPGGIQDLGVFLDREHRMPLCGLQLSQSGLVLQKSYRLSPFETRFLAENGYPHPVPNHDFCPVKLQTDLHVHFAGCVLSRDLIEIGLQTNVEYPACILREAGISTKGTSAPLRSLTTQALAALETALAIPLNRQITFLEMERIYRIRSPITKLPDAFVPLLNRIAFDYAAMGVSYTELSFSNILMAGFLEKVHRFVPSIEEKTGVRMRFLAGFWRHSDLEWDLDCIERIMAIGKSRFLAGVDFMGHETNSTRAFSRQIKKLAAWAHENRPGFVIRVHAGENPAFPENVRVAWESVAGKNVQLRIGHGLYGTNQDTLDWLRESNAIVEFNLGSNFALNNIQGAYQVPICTYLESGVQVVLGSDGYGIYQTTMDLEGQAGWLCGLTKSDFLQIGKTERDYQEERKDHEARYSDPPSEYNVPPDAPGFYYTPEIEAKKEVFKNSRNNNLKEKLANENIPVLAHEEVGFLLRGKTVVSVSGAWNQSWARISDDGKREIAELFGELLSQWSPDNTILLAGGTNLGVEGMLFSMARPMGFICLGTLVWETPPESLACTRMTKACIIGETLYDKAAGLYSLVKDHNGFCIFVGGGPIVSDEIQTAANLRLRYFLMDGPPGASTEHAVNLPDNRFRTAKEILGKLKEAPTWQDRLEPYWHLGPNPTVDIVLIRFNSAIQEKEVLLIQRSFDSSAEPGKWALPGGFQLTDAPRGTPWVLGQESASFACLRELKEETGLDLHDLEAQLVPIGIYQGGGRDPRDTLTAWSKSHAFAFQMPEGKFPEVIAGGDDAIDAHWFSLKRLPANLAFDHSRILKDGLRALKLQEASGSVT